MILPKFPKINAKGVTRAIFHEMAPNLVKGFIKEMTGNQPALDGYNVLMTNDLWDLLPEERKPYLINMKPWDLSWLSISWIYDVFKECNPELASLLVTSPAFQDRMNEQISKMKTLLT